MSRILQALQHLERSEKEEDRVVIPISQGISEPSDTELTISEAAFCPPQQPESPSHHLVRRFDPAHDEGIDPASPHFTGDEQNAVLDCASRDLQDRVAEIWERYQAAIPSALVETWVMSATWKPVAASQPGWVSGQFLDSGSAAECALAVAFDVAETLGQPLLVIDGESPGDLTQRLGIRSGSSLTEVMLGRATLENSIISLTDNGLSFLPNRPGDGSHGLPNWADVRDLFQSARAAFGLTFVFCRMANDPLSSRIFSQCDDFWLWCREGRTPVRQVKWLMKEATRLRRQMAGTILITR
ncbi:MAG: hypothetical protein ACUVQR_13200 [Thermogutta sp.]